MGSRTFILCPTHEYGIMGLSVLYVHVGVQICLWVWDHGHKTIRVSLLRLFCRLNEFQNDSKNGKRLNS